MTPKYPSSKGVLTILGFVCLVIYPLISYYPMVSFFGVFTSSRHISRLTPPVDDVLLRRTLPRRHQTGPLRVRVRRLRRRRPASHRKRPMDCRRTCGRMATVLFDGFFVPPR